MRKVLCGAAMALVMAVWVVPAGAAGQAEPDPDPDKTINISGEIRARWEYLENFSDQDDSTDDNFDFWPYRARVAADGQFADNIFGKAEIQTFGYFGDDFAEKSSQSPVGQAFDVNSDAEVSLYQAYVRLAELGGSNWGLKIGRQEYTLGNELHFGDADFYNGISFDGARATMDGEKLDLDIFYYMLDDFGGTSIVDEQNELWGATLNFGIGGGNQYIEPYLVYNRQTEDKSGSSNFTRVRTWMFGALWANPVNEDSVFDWSVEAAMQSGEADTGTSPVEVDQSGLIGEAWLGFTFAEAHRVHVGALYASGDDGTDPSDNEAFFPLFPDEHAYNRLGDIDFFGGTTPGSAGYSGSLMTNITDLNAGYTWMGEKKQFRASLHNLTRSEEVDPDGPGPLGLEDAVGDEIDLVYNSDLSQNLAYELGYAQLLPGDALAISPTQDGDDVMRAWLQFRLRWN